MAKSASRYVCQSCGAAYQKWSGHCAACNEWNTIEQEALAPQGTYTRLGAGKRGGSAAAGGGQLVEFTSLTGAGDSAPRTPSGLDELDRVLGGGLVAGSAILVGGDPGIGKSTLMLQMGAHFALHGLPCAYITGEESIAQIRMRAQRLGVSGAPLQLASATSVGDIISSLQKSEARIVIIDSIQTMYVDTIEAAPGTVGQVRAASAELIQFAKASGIALFLIGHVTKEGQIAGPKVLEHMVDTVLYFEGDRGNQFRILRAVKNRYGGVNEIGVFEMTNKGLLEVKNPSSLFISGKAGQVSGSVIFAGIEGTRPVLVEVQALISPTPTPQPRRAVVGWDANRLAMVIAILQTRAGIKLYDKEVYLNIAGGIRIQEPAADVAVAAAIISSLLDKPLPEGSILFGELGLSGEVRPVQQMEARLKEAEKLGFTRAYVPPGTPRISKAFSMQEIPYIKQLQNILKKEDAAYV